MGLPHTALQGALRVAPIWAPRCFGSAAMVRRVLHTHVSVKVGGVPSSNDGDIVLGWALDGHGILIRSEWDLAKYLESGRLRVVLPQFKLPSADLFVYYSQRRNQTARARAFIDFLVSKFQKSLEEKG